MDKTQIQKQAKEILDKFASALEKVEKQKFPDSYVDREEFERKEKNTKQPTTKDFKKRILENAPNSNQDFILTEKGSWK